MVLPVQPPGVEEQLSDAARWRGLEEKDSGKKIPIE
jgi:hypothetical protein